jgi:starvation-inducible DNA-binding protein
MVARDARALKIASLETPTDLKPNSVREISAALNTLLADMFALYVKTKNLSLARIGAAFPRLSPFARQAGRADLRHDR